VSYKVIAIVGPTAVGKSDVGVKLAHLFNGEIINGDSIQVYKGLDVGSAKITEEEKEGIKHYLLDIVDIGEDYNVYSFQKDGRKLIKELNDKGIIPIIVGGTGLYIKALLYDYEFKENEENNEKEYDEFSNEQLYQMLIKIDPKACEKIHQNNRRRVIRALQIAKSGQLKSAQEANQQHKLLYDAYIVGLTMQREILRERIDLRVDKMIENGLLKEIENIQKEHSFDEQGLSGIGYKEFKEYYEGKITLKDTVDLIKTHTKQFVKRQYTWFNNQMDVHWYDVLEKEYFEQLSNDIKEWLK